MQLSTILPPINTVNNAHADSKKGVLELISKLIAQNFVDIEYKKILSCLINREKLGSTSIGHGVAIPHGRLKNLPKPTAAFVHLQKAIDFAANDNQPVDLFFALLVPEEQDQEHLEILSEIAEKFSHKDFREQLRNSKDNKTLYRLIIGN
jgi:PTS system nitrogen regulatory IIA component